MKHCTGCQTTKPLSDFHLKKRDADPTLLRSYQSRCRDCHRESLRAWTAANPDKKRLQRRRYNERHPDKVKEAKRRWQYSERGRETRAAWMARNGASNAEYQQHYRATIGRWKQIEKKYGLSREAYEALLISQRGACPICRSDLTEVQIHVDHCHDTGRVRGLLCQRCNQALGLLGDDAAAAGRAARYLRR